MTTIRRHRFFTDGSHFRRLRPDISQPSSTDLRNDETIAPPNTSTRSRTINQSINCLLGPPICDKRITMHRNRSRPDVVSKRVGKSHRVFHVIVSSAFSRFPFAVGFACANTGTDKLYGYTGWYRKPGNHKVRNLPLKSEKGRKKK